MILSFSYLSSACMTCSMKLARNTKTEVTIMCRYRILLWKQHHPVHYWFIMDADTKTVLLFYWIALHYTTGINRYKAILSQYRICTLVFTGKLNGLQSNEHISLLARVVWVIKMFVKKWREHSNLFVCALPTYILIEIVDEHKIGRCV